MSRLCPVCAHERRAAIDELLRERIAEDIVAIAFGLPDGVVERHVRHVDRPRRRYVRRR